MNDASIIINYERYKEIYSDSKKVEVSINFDHVIFPKALLDLFIYNQKYYRIFKKALFDKFNINVIVTQSEDVIIKKVYSPISILEGINKLDEELPSKFLSNLPALLNKIDFKKFISKNKNKIFSFKVDNDVEEIKYGELTRIILDKKSFDLFLNEPNDICLKKVFLLKEFMKEEKIFLAYSLPVKSLEYYKFLIQKYDTEAINKNLVSNFKYSDKYKLDVNFEKYLFNIRTNILTKKVIYLYLNLIFALRYDYEYIEDNSIIKKHRDYTRIEYINQINNLVTSYEFSLIFAKCLEKMNLKFDYNDNYIIVRIEKFILKFKAISFNYNASVLSVFDILKEIGIKNNNENTSKEFYNIINIIIKELNTKKLDKEIFNMSFNELKDIYKTSSSKRLISFKQKYDIFYKLISNVNEEYNAIGYILELKKILFSNELNVNILFNIVIEGNNPVVIVTINNININLYNSNRYIYFNPPKKIEEYNLNEIRMMFFKGRFKYNNNDKDSIIGIEKSNV